MISNSQMLYLSRRYEDLGIDPSLILRSVCVCLCVLWWEGGGVFLYRQRRENIKIYVKGSLFIKNTPPPPLVFQSVYHANKY